MLIPIAAILCGPGAWVVTTWIRAKHGYPLDDGEATAGREASASVGRTIGLLTSENERLIGKLARLEDRIAVLERIATDPAERTAREIEALR